MRLYNQNSNRFQINEDQARPLANYLVDFIRFNFDFPAIYISIVVFLFVIRAFIPESIFLKFDEMGFDITDEDIKSWYPIIMFVVYLFRVFLSRIIGIVLRPWHLRKKVILYGLVISVGVIVASNYNVLGSPEHFPVWVVAIIGGLLFFAGVVTMSIASQIGKVQTVFLGEKVETKILDL